MARLPRFSEHRFVGDRSTMTVFDTDDTGESEALIERVETHNLMGENLLQTFGPDTLVEARNRGFSPPT
jgi:hypothetical protein